MAESDQAPKMKLVGAVVQAIRLLQVLEASDRPLGVSALAREAKINPSTAFNILRTLAVEKLVAFDELSKTYVLGTGLLALSRKLLGDSLIAEIRPEMQRLANETSCLVGIWQATADRMILIERVVADRPMRLDMAVKQRLPLMIGAVGRAMAAHRGLSPAELRAIFATLRWETAIDVETYLAQVEEAARTGYGVDLGTLFPGVTSVGVVIPGGRERPVYGLTASDIAGAVRPERVAEIGTRMVAIARLFAGERS